MDDRTSFRVDLDDETVAAVMEQAQEARCQPRDLMAAVLRDTFLFAKKNGARIAYLPPGAPSPSKFKQ